jgi:acyl phosphate:glycerol-3-phosphate acyltransferase
MITATIFLVIAYLMGSICSAIVVCKLMHLPDPRSQGSNNPGATNVLRIGGKTPAALTLLGDMLKGFIPVLLAAMFGVHGIALGLVAIAALLGHIFPLFFKFKGGKGVATAIGALFGLSLLLGLLAGLTWILVAYIFRYSSLAALVMIITAPIYTLILGDFSYFFPVLIMAGILFWRHWGNIQRLRSGVESKISF